MTHKRALGKDLSDKIERASLAQLRMMLIMILVMMSKKGHLTKAQRRSLAITESSLGIRKKVRREAEETRGKGKRAKRGGGKGRKRATQGQLRARRKFKAFIRRHGRPPRKGEKL